MSKKVSGSVYLKMVCLIVFVSLLIVSCKSGTNDGKPIETADFKTVKIGTQEWMTENLTIETFRNGDLIPEIKTNEEWELAEDEGKPGWCYYENDAETGKIYGKLYNWFAVNDKRGLAPAGWHIPDMNDWSTLVDFLGGEDIAGVKMKSLSGWNEDGSGSDDSGFSGLPGGHRADFGGFYSLGDNGAWWSSTRQDEIPNYAFRLGLNYENGTVDWVYDKYGSAYSVRCVKD